MKKIKLLKPLPDLEKGTVIILWDDWNFYFENKAQLHNEFYGIIYRMVYRSNDHLWVFYKYITEKKTKFQKFLGNICEFSNWSYVISADVPLEEFYSQLLAETDDFDSMTFQEFKEKVKEDYVRFCWGYDDDYERVNMRWLWQDKDKKWAKKVYTFN